MAMHAHELVSFWPASPPMAHRAGVVLNLLLQNMSVALCGELLGRWGQAGSKGWLLVQAGVLTAVRPSSMSDRELLGCWKFLQVLVYTRT
jgi:hypothetical protein